MPKITKQSTRSATPYDCDNQQHNQDDQTSATNNAPFTANVTPQVNESAQGDDYLHPTSPVYQPDSPSYNMFSPSYLPYTPTRSQVEDLMERSTNAEFKASAQNYLLTLQSDDYSDNEEESTSEWE